ncbi:transposase [Duganella sp. SG902]|nr:transposase [Duganella sp. SG902]
MGNRTSHNSGAGNFNLVMDSQSNRLSTWSTVANDQHRHFGYGADLVKIGEDVSEQLDVELARFFVHRHIRPQYACRPCETVTATTIPPAATGLLAWITACKYLDHLPLYRIEQIAARQGVPLARSTLAEWIGRIGVALQPLADRLAELLRQQACLPTKHRCANPIPVAEKPNTPICGLTAPACTTPAHPSLCSTIKPAGPVPMHGRTGSDTVLHGPVLCNELAE